MRPWQRRGHLLLRCDNVLVVLVHDLLHLRVDELIEGLELLPHQALLLKVGRDDGPRVLLRPRRNPR